MALSWNPEAILAAPRRRRKTRCCLADLLVFASPPLTGGMIHLYMGECSKDDRFASGWGCSGGETHACQLRNPFFPGWLVCSFARCWLLGRLVAWLLAWSLGRLVAWSLGWLLGCLVASLVVWLLASLLAWLFSCLIASLLGWWLANISWLVAVFC